MMFGFLQNKEIGLWQKIHQKARDGVAQGRRQEGLYVLANHLADHDRAAYQNHGQAAQQLALERLRHAEPLK